jgi:hypothetical protein
MTDLFTSADQRKRERQLEELATHCALVMTKALKLMKGGGIIENKVRKEMRETLETIKRTRAA